MREVLALLINVAFFRIIMRFFFFDLPYTHEVLSSFSFPYIHQL
jgi:hypothetical protein